MTLSETEINQRFSALKEHGEEIAAAFKDFVKKLDAAVPNGVSKTKLVNALETASGWAHNALADAEQEARKLAHQASKSGVKPQNPVVTPPASTTPTDTTPVQDAPPAAPVTPEAPAVKPA
jgi:hypothetical protein